MTNHKGGQILQIPYWERYLLTIREAAEYFHIGEKKLRQIVEENGTADFIIMNGNRAMIKRKAFEQYLDQATAV
jgi:excisionase family DNA binding protein